MRFKVKCASYARKDRKAMLSTVPLLTPLLINIGPLRGNTFMMRMHKSTAILVAMENTPSGYKEHEVGEC